MKRLTLVLAAAAALLAQQTRKEIVSPSKNPADDSKPNSASVPDVYAVNTNFSRVVLLRFKFNADLLAGLEKMVKEEKIQNAVFLSAIGSVRNYQVHQVSNRTFPSKDVFVKDPAAPADITGISGYVMNGRIHAHLTMATPNGAFGGHLEPGTNVFTFAVITVGVLPGDLDLSRLDDKTDR